MTDFRALCAELLQFGDQAGEIAGNEGLWPDCDPGPDWLLDRARAALAQPEPTPPLEPRGCPTPGACSCPTAPTVPPDLIRALELAEAGLSDIGDADREPGDDLAWAEARAAQDLPRIRRTLNTWRDHSALAQPEPVAPTDEEIMELMPQQMRDDLAAAAKALAGFDRAKAAAVFRIILNRHAVDHARAALAKWGSND